MIDTMDRFFAWFAGASSFEAGDFITRGVADFRKTAAMQSVARLRATQSVESAAASGQITGEQMALEEQKIRAVEESERSSADYDDALIVLAVLGARLVGLGAVNQAQVRAADGAVRQAFQNVAGSRYLERYSRLERSVQIGAMCGLAFCAECYPMHVWRGFGAAVRSQWDWAIFWKVRLPWELLDKSILFFKSAPRSFTLLKNAPEGMDRIKPVERQMAKEDKRRWKDNKKDRKALEDEKSAFVKRVEKKGFPQPVDGSFAITSWSVVFASWESHHAAMNEGHSFDNILRHQADPGRLLHAFVAGGHLNLREGECVVIPAGPAAILVRWLEGLEGTTFRLVREEDLDFKKVGLTTKKLVHSVMERDAYAVRDAKAVARKEERERGRAEAAAKVTAASRVAAISGPSSGPPPPMPEDESAGGGSPPFGAPPPMCGDEKAVGTRHPFGAPPPMAGEEAPAGERGQELCGPADPCRPPPAGSQAEPGAQPQTPTNGKSPCQADSPFHSPHPQSHSSGTQSPQDAYGPPPSMPADTPSPQRERGSFDPVQRRPVGSFPTHSYGSRLPEDVDNQPFQQHHDAFSSPDLISPFGSMSLGAHPPHAPAPFDRGSPQQMPSGGHILHHNKTLNYPPQSTPATDSVSAGAQVPWSYGHPPQTPPESPLSQHKTAAYFTMPTPSSAYVGPGSVPHHLSGYPQPAPFALPPAQPRPASHYLYQTPVHPDFPSPVASPTSDPHYYAQPPPSYHDTFFPPPPSRGPTQVHATGLSASPPPPPGFTTPLPSPGAPHQIPRRAVSTAGPRPAQQAPYPSPPPAPALPG